MALLKKSKRIYTVKKNDPLLSNPAAILRLIRANPALAKRTTGSVLKPGDVIRVPVGGVTTMGHPDFGGGSNDSGYGNKGVIKPKPTKPKKVTPILKVNKPNPKPKPKPKKPTPLRPAVAPPQSPVRPQVSRVYSPQGSGMGTVAPYRPQPTRPTFNTTAGVTSAYRPTVSNYRPTVFDYSNMMSPVTGGGMGTVAPVRPQPVGMPQRPVRTQPIQDERAENIAARKAQTNATGQGLPNVLPMPLLQPDNTQAPYVVDLQGNAIPGSDITLWYLEQGMRPLVVTPYHQNLLGITAEEMVMAGYVQDDWGNWIRSDDTSGTPVASGGKGGIGQSSSYGGYGGGGWGGYGDGGGGGYGYEPSGRQKIFGSEMGAVTWRI